MLGLAINKPVLQIMTPYNEGLFSIYYFPPCKYPYCPRVLYNGERGDWVAECDQDNPSTRLSW